MYRDLFSFEFQKDTKRVLYFDAACSYIKYKKTLEGITKYYKKYAGCSGDRQSSVLGSELYLEIELTRKEILRFIGASMEDIVVFCSSATDGINLLVGALDTGKISSLIVSDIEHNSNFLPQYEFTKQTGKKFEIFPYVYLEDFTKLESYLQKLQAGFLLSCTHCSNITGKVFDIGKIAQLVHKYHGYILVDDAQYITHHSEKFSENDIDFCVFSAHKLGGPTGIGALIIRSKSSFLLTHSRKVGGGTIRTLEDNIPLYKPLPYILEAGVQDFAGILGFKSCLLQIQEIGMEKIFLYISGLQQYFLEQLSAPEFTNIFLYISSENSPIITLVPKRFSAQDFHQYCNFFTDSDIISFRTGTMCADMFTQQYLQTTNIMRISFGIYNSNAEIDVFFDILRQYIGTCK